MALVRKMALAVAALAGLTAAAPRADPAPGAPRLIVAIAVDQYSADLFAQYRQRYTGGLARLAGGVVFPAGYQSHAATETCPGHSTILTGMRPAHTGIIANTWFDLGAARANKQIYCAEDETRAAPEGDYVASVAHLLVPTLGERIKAVWPTSRNVAVSGKDRAALMMGGHQTDAVYWWKGKGFVTLEGRALDRAAVEENAEVAGLAANGAPGYALPADCARADRPVTAGATTVGNGRLALPAGDDKAFEKRLRGSPHIDRATLDLATRLVDADRLGRGPTPDLLAISLSATDYIGHAFGTEGAEMCIQMHELDASLGAFFAALDARGIDYMVVLTADHGGIDLPERLHEQALPQAARADRALYPAAVSERVAAKLGIDAKGLFVAEGASGDWYVRRDLSAEAKAKAIAAAKADLEAQPQVAAVFTAGELAATPVPAGPSPDWSLLQRARASFYAPHSGDFVVLLKRAVVPVPVPASAGATVTTHGSAWDYDRRVPILFWRKGMAPFEQPNPVETVDIAPTLAAVIGLDVSRAGFDGRCLDLDAGTASTCGAAH